MRSGSGLTLQNCHFSQREQTLENSHQAHIDCFTGGQGIWLKQTFFKIFFFTLGLWAWTTKLPFFSKGKHIRTLAPSTTWLFQWRPTIFPLMLTIQQTTWHRLIIHWKYGSIHNTIQHLIYFQHWEYSYCISYLFDNLVVFEIF